MKKIMKVVTIMLVMVMVLTGATPTVTEAKTKTSITVANKATGKKIGKKVTLKTGEKIQLKVKYGKKVITKKAKYKTSNKSIATVNKKGKITTKTAGTCTVKVTYKKAVKKIKVTVKADTVKSTEASTEVAKHEPITIDDSPAEALRKLNIPDNDDLSAYNEIYKYNIKKLPATKENFEKLKAWKVTDSDPHPECAHEWIAIRYHSDIKIPVDKFGELYKDHLVLDKIFCDKCGTLAYTNPIPVSESLFKYTSDDYAKTIRCYGRNRSSNQDRYITHITPKHKCTKNIDYGWIPPEKPVLGDTWMEDNECTLCGADIWD